VPAIVVSPWVEAGSVHDEEHRHTSLIATLRSAWQLGDAFTQRDASARTFEHVFSLSTPRDPTTWTSVTARPVPDWEMDPEVVGEALSTLGKGLGPGMLDLARSEGVTLPAELADPDAELAPGLVVPFLRAVSLHFFPLLAPRAEAPDGA
jgi:phospholipase C